MSLQTVSIPLSATTTALFRNWAAAISAALTALGLTKTADTGQVVLTGSTLAYPTTAQGLSQGYAAYAAYEIRQMVSSGKPTIYLKVRYGIYYNATGSGANYYWPALSIEFGQSTDGAGNITPFDAGGSRPGISSTGSCTGSAAASSGRPSPTAQNCYLASDGANYLTVIMGNQAPSYESYWLMAGVMERTNVPGASAFAYDGTGFTAVNALTPASDNTQTVAGAVPATGLNLSVSSLTDISNLASYYGSVIAGQTPAYTYKPNVSTDATLYPVTVGVGHGPMVGIFAVDIGQLIENTQVTFSPYNVSHVFVAASRVNVYGDPRNITSMVMRID